MSDLVERLRAVVNAGPDFLGNDEGRCVTCSYRNPDGPEAAAELERLYARVAKLESVISGGIEITPEMIEAGRKAYCGPFEGPERYRQADIALVSAIYLAMRAALTNSGAPDDEG